MLRRLMVPSSLYDPSVQALIDRATALGYTIPNATKLNVLNTFVVSLKAAGIWALLDELKVYKYNDVTLQNFASLNLKNPLTSQSTIVGVNCTYGVNGWLGGAASAINTNFIPSIDGINYTLNNSGFGCYVYNDALNANQVIGSIGSAGVGSRTYMYVRFTATSFNINVSSGTTLSTGANATSVGFHCANRPTGAVQNYYIDGAVKQGNSAAAAGSLSDRASYVCGANNNGATIANNSQGVSMNYHGADLTSKMVDFHNAWNAFNTTI